MDYGGLTAELGVADGEEGGPNLCAPEKVEMQGNGVRLVLRGEGGFEVEGCDLEKGPCSEAALRYWGGLALFHRELVGLSDYDVIRELYLIQCTSHRGSLLRRYAARFASMPLPLQRSLAALLPL